MVTGEAHWSQVYTFTWYVIEAPWAVCQCPEALTALALTLGSAKCYVKHHWSSANAQMCQRSWTLTVSQGCFTYHSDSPTVNVNAVNAPVRWQWARDASQHPSAYSVNVNAVNAPGRWQWARDASHATQVHLVSMATLSTPLGIDNETRMLHIPLQPI